MYDINDLATFAWKDLDPAYALTSRSRVQGDAVATKGTRQDWAQRTADRLLSCATAAIEVRLYHAACPSADLCATCCPGQPIVGPKRLLFSSAVGRVRSSEAKLVAALAQLQHPESGTLVFESLYMNLNVMYKAVFQAIHEAVLQTVDNSVVQPEYHELRWARGSVIQAIADEADEAGVPLPRPHSPPVAGYM